MRRRTTAAAGALITAALSTGFPGTASAADRDCADFASQAAAQAAFEAVPGDPERLDANSNGVACEDYVYAAAPAAAPAPAAPVPAASTPQVATRPAGAVAAGDGSTADPGSPLPFVLAGVGLVAAGGAAMAARRSSRATA